MKSIFCSVLSALIFLASPQAFAAPVVIEHPAAIFIYRLGERAVEYGAISSTSDKRRKFCELVKRNTNIDGVVKTVLGNYYSSSTDGQRRDVKDFIHDLLAEHLTKAFESAQGGRLNVHARVIEANPVGVNADLITAGGIIKHKFLFFVQNEKIVDARIKNVLISRYLKNEYTSFMDRHGGNAPVASLIDHLSGENPACP